MRTRRPFEVVVRYTNIQSFEVEAENAAEAEEMVMEHLSGGDVEICIGDEETTETEVASVTEKEATA